MQTARGSPGLPPLDLARSGDASGRVRLTVTGEVDFSNADRLRAAVAEILHERGVSRLDVDLGPLRFLDSSGAQSLVWCLQLAGSRHIGFAVTNARGIVLRVLEVLGIDKALGARPAA